MARDSCAPCCQPQQFGRSKESFQAANLQILCDILDALGGAPTDIVRYDYEVLCDPSAGTPVLLRFGYDNDGTNITVAGFLPDGSAYGGGGAKEFTGAAGAGGTGTTIGGNIGGGNGGVGGSSSNAGSGGGAGGYSGNGGAGVTTGTGNSGSGGGGGSGGSTGTSSGGGGGVGLLGEGTSGAGGSSSPTGGGGGSGGSSGSGNVGGAYGGGAGAATTRAGGGGGGLRYANNVSVTPGDVITVVVGAAGTGNASGGSGAVRIIWGENRSFPSTNTGDL